MAGVYSLILLSLASLVAASAVGVPKFVRHGPHRCRSGSGGVLCENLLQDKKDADNADEVYPKNVIIDDPYSILTRMFDFPFDSLDYLVEYYRFEKPKDIPSIINSLGEQVNVVKAVGKGIPFCFFVDKHVDSAKALIKIFLDAPNVKDLAEKVQAMKDVANEMIFLYALYYTFLNRKDLNASDVPPLYNIAPDRFVPNQVFHELFKTYKDTVTDRPQNITVEWVPDQTRSSFVNLEHQMAYFREDFHLNAQQWHWHLANPFFVPAGTRDRRGESFYYMHFNMLARYDMDRIAFGLNPVGSLAEWRSPVSQGHFPHLSLYSGEVWAARQDNTSMKNVPAFGLSVSQLEDYRDKLKETLDKGFVFSPKGEKIQLTDSPASGERLGVDILGDILDGSVNSELYGNLNNLGHALLGASHDPNSLHNSGFGVMMSTETAIRDPVFFQWHKFIDDFFHRYKMTQSPYTKEQLTFSGVKLLEVEVNEVGESSSNTLTTFFTTSTFDASRGIAFRTHPEANHNISVFVRIGHLDHKDFSYKIKVENTNDKDVRPTVRIFLAPKFAVDGHLMSFEEQQRFWTEMDTFVADGIPPGVSYITRSSRDFSTITHPTTIDGSPGEDSFNFAGCGWPYHLLVPRGRPEGMTFQLFAMISDASFDQVPLKSFCCHADSPYPDRQPMGFPLDRKIKQEFVKDFVDEYSNMAVTDLDIKHNSEISI